MTLLSRAFAIVALTFVCAVAQAAKVARVDVVGLDDTMTNNVRVSLSLVDAIGKDIPGRRLGYLVRTAEDETREALEPFGIYSPQIKVERTREDEGTIVTVTVVPGDAVKVRKADIAILGEGGQDTYLQEDLGAFTPRTGDVFNHALYEASKLRITRRLAERGYFDTQVTSHKVSVNRAEKAADIDLKWTSGDRYNMGVTTFIQAPERIIREEVLEKLIYWAPGDYYHQGRLDRLRKSLVALDYFSRVDIQPHPEKATGDKEVPIEVSLTPAKRSIYTAGLSFGTVSGAGVRLGVERRYVNDLGHKALAQIDFAQNKKAATVQYRIPAFAWLDGWYTFSLQGVDEQSDYIDDRRIEFVASRSGQINTKLNAVAALHVLRERWLFAPDLSGGAATLVRPEYRYASYLYPELRGDYVDVNDRTFPTRGFAGSASLIGGLESVGSDANFAQAKTRVTWFRGFGARNRLILRGEIGHTFSNAQTDLPPSLRFYAGGDRSIRGYEFREVGPRIQTAKGKFSTGADNLVTASAEFERYFTDALGAAVFVDSGDAFNSGSPNMRTGVGIGARYKSPVGPIKVDLARGLNQPDSPFTVGLSIGAEF